MVQETGKAMAEALTSVARDCYQNRAFTALWSIIDVNFSQLRPTDTVIDCCESSVGFCEQSLSKILGIRKLRGKAELQDEILCENLEFTIVRVYFASLSLSSTFYSHGNSISILLTRLVFKIFLLDPLLNLENWIWRIEKGKLKNKYTRIIWKYKKFGTFRV